MNNVVQFQSEMFVSRNGNVIWRPVPIMSDDDLFDEYRAIREEIRRRQNERGAVH